MQSTWNVYYLAHQRLLVRTHLSEVSTKMTFCQNIHSKALEHIQNHYARFFFTRIQSQKIGIGTYVGSSQNTAEFAHSQFVFSIWRVELKGHCSIWKICHTDIFVCLQYLWFPRRGGWLCVGCSSRGPAHGRRRLLQTKQFLRMVSSKGLQPRKTSLHM